MVTRAFVNRKRSLEPLLSSARTHANNVGEACDKVLIGRLPEVDTKAFILGMVATLEDQFDQYGQALKALSDELADDPPIRAKLEEKRSVHYQHLVLWRQQIEALYGSEAVRFLGFEGNTPQESRTMLAFSQSLYERADQLAGYAAKIDFVQLDIEAMKVKLLAFATAHQEAFDASIGEQHEADAALVKKDQLQASYDRAFQYTATMLQCFFRMAGEDELASRIRPSYRRPGQLHEAPEQEEAQVEPEA